MDVTPLLQTHMIIDEVKRKIDKQDRNGDTPVHHAARRWSMEDISNLLKCDPDLTITNKDGLTAGDIVTYSEIKPKKNMCNIM